MLYLKQNSGHIIPPLKILLNSLIAYRIVVTNAYVPILPSLILSSDMPYDIKKNCFHVYGSHKSFKDKNCFIHFCVNSTKHII